MKIILVILICYSEYRILTTKVSIIHFFYHQTLKPDKKIEMLFSNSCEIRTIEGL